MMRLFELIAELFTPICDCCLVRDGIYSHAWTHENICLVCAKAKGYLIPGIDEDPRRSHPCDIAPQESKRKRAVGRKK